MVVPTTGTFASTVGMETIIGPIVDSVEVAHILTVTFALINQTESAYEVSISTSFSETTAAGTLITSVLSAYTFNTYASGFSFTAVSPCCSSCTIWAGHVNVYYWPPVISTAPSIPSVTSRVSSLANMTTSTSEPLSTLVKDGFTL
jgi:hypothetical protein